MDCKTKVIQEDNIGAAQSMWCSRLQYTLFSLAGFMILSFFVKLLIQLLCHLLLRSGLCHAAVKASLHLEVTLRSPCGLPTGIKRTASRALLP